MKQTAYTTLICIILSMYASAYTQVSASSSIELKFDEILFTYVGFRLSNLAPRSDATRSKELFNRDPLDFICEDLSYAVQSNPAITRLYGTDLLFTAAQEGWAYTICKMLTNKATPYQWLMQQKTPDGNTAFMLAVKANQAYVVQLLIRCLLPLPDRICWNGLNAQQKQTIIAAISRETIINDQYHLHYMRKNSCSFPSYITNHNNRHSAKAQ